MSFSVIVMFLFVCLISCLTSTIVMYYKNNSKVAVLA